MKEILVNVKAVKSHRMRATGEFQRVSGEVGPALGPHHRRQGGRGSEKPCPLKPFIPVKSFVFMMYHLTVSLVMGTCF